MATAKPSRSTTPKARATAKPATKASTTTTKTRSAAKAKPAAKSKPAAKPKVTKGDQDAIAVRAAARKEAAEIKAKCSQIKDDKAISALEIRAERSRRVGATVAVAKTARKLGYQEGLALAKELLA